MTAFRRAQQAVQAGALSDADAMLTELAAEYYDDPLSLVMAQYPWGEAGTMLHDTREPDAWQCEFLEWLGDEIKARAFDGRAAVLPIRAIVSSGHGIGKSVTAAMLVNLLMPTRPYCRGTVTSNTFAQLSTKTWAAIQRWHKLSVFAPWFIVTSNRFYHRDYKESWFCAPQSCKEQNSEAFAGQHAAESTSFYIFDEDSAISGTIHEVSEGGLTDGEPMAFRFGNPTRSTGSFHQDCFGTGRDKWHPRIIDARTSRYTNKVLIQEWEDEHGEDSDFFRVRVRGLPPRASDLQFIDTQRVYEAQQRVLQTVFDDEPVVAGADFSDGGSAYNVVRFRRGLDARSIPPIRVPGEQTRGDRSGYLARLADLLREGVVDANGKRHKVAALFCDSAFGAPYVERLQAMGFKQVHEVRFGSTTTPDRHVANMRAYMWAKAKDWLLRGCIPDDVVLETDLTGPGFHLDRQDRLVIESKESMAKRGVASPDDGDALCLSFAAAVLQDETMDLGRFGIGNFGPPPAGQGWMGS